LGTPRAVFQLTKPGQLLPFGLGFQANLHHLHQTALLADGDFALTKTTHS
jgi:hypothetical protein